MRVMMAFTSLMKYVEEKLERSGLNSPVVIPHCIADRSNSLQNNSACSNECAQVNVSLWSNPLPPENSGLSLCSEGRVAPSDLTVTVTFTFSPKIMRLGTVPFL